MSSKEMRQLEQDFLESVKKGPGFEKLKTNLLMSTTLIGHQNALNGILDLAWHSMKSNVTELISLRKRTNTCEKKRRGANLQHLKELEFERQRRLHLNDPHWRPEQESMAKVKDPVQFFDPMMFEDEEVRELVQQCVARELERITASGDGGEWAKRISGNNKEVISIKDAEISMLRAEVKKFESLLQFRRENEDGSGEPGNTFTNGSVHRNRTSDRGGPQRGPSFCDAANDDSSMQWKLKYEEAVKITEKQAKRYEKMMEKMKRGHDAADADSDESEDEADVPVDDLSIHELKSALIAARLEIKQLKSSAASRRKTMEKSKFAVASDGTSLFGGSMDDVEESIMLDENAPPDEQICALKRIVQIRDAKIAKLVKRINDLEREHGISPVDAVSSISVNVKRKEKSEKGKSESRQSNRRKPNEDIKSRKSKSRKDRNSRSGTRGSGDEDDDLSDYNDDDASATDSDSESGFCTSLAEELGTAEEEQHKRARVEAQLKKVLEKKKEQAARITKLETAVGEMTRKLHELRKLLGDEVCDPEVAAKLDDIFDEAGLAEIMKLSGGKVYNRLYEDGMQRLRRLEDKRARCLQELKEVTHRLIEAKRLLSEEKELYVGRKQDAWQSPYLNRNRVSTSGGPRRVESAAELGQARRRILVSDEPVRAHLPRAGVQFPPEKPIIPEPSVSPQPLPNLKSLTHLVKYSAPVDSAGQRRSSLP